MARAVKDKARQLSRRTLRKLENKTKKQRDFLLFLSVIEAFLLIVSIFLIFLL